MSTAQNLSRKIYFSVVEDVIANVREAFLDEGVDEQVLQELKQLWESKLITSRALEASELETPGQTTMQYVMQAPTQQHIVQGTALQHQIPVPVQIATEGQISNAASMAFNAQGGMYAQQVQALVNVNPGQIALQPTANGQFILHTMPPGVTQGQMVTLPQQAVLQNQQMNQTQSQQGIPQLDGTHEEDNSHRDKTSSTLESDCTVKTKNMDQLLSNSDSTVLQCKSVSERQRRKQRRNKVTDVDVIVQFDGNHDTSSSEDDNYDDDDDDDDDDKEEADDAGGEDEEPLNSGDDVSEVDPQELFDTDNVVVCQFEKVSRNKNKWKFNLKDGIMNLDGKDHVFQRGTGEADW